MINNILNDYVFKITSLVLIAVLLIGKIHIKDINTHTILSLFALMISVQLLKQLKLLDYINYVLMKKADNNRQLVLFLVILAFFSSMILTNDVAILTIVPLYLVIANRQNFKKALPITLITIAANLGSMGMPFGNPQNIFLISYYKWPLSKFIITVLPILIISIVILILLTFLISRSSINISKSKSINLNKYNIMYVIIGMIIVLLSIFNIVNIWIAVILNLIIAIFINHRILYQIDYGLLLTLIEFFLIVGVLSRNNIIYTFIQSIISSSYNAYFISIITSQFISNVPASILIAKFSHQILPVFLGTNIGGLGTLVASLANLITLKQIINYNHKLIWKFIKIFLIINFCLLILMVLVGLLVLKL